VRSSPQVRQSRSKAAAARQCRVPRMTARRPTQSRLSLQTTSRCTLLHLGTNRRTQCTHQAGNRRGSRVHGVEEPEPARLVHQAQVHGCRHRRCSSIRAPTICDDAYCLSRWEYTFRCVSADQNEILSPRLQFTACRVCVRKGRNALAASKLNKASARSPDGRPVLCSSDRPPRRT
jgi:hypothetical protein